MNNSYAIEVLEERIRVLVVQKNVNPRGYHSAIDKEIKSLQSVIKQLSSKDKEQIDCYSKDGELINEHSSTDKVIASGVVTDDKKNMLFKVGGKEIALSVYPDWLGLELRKLVDKQVELILREVK